MAYVTALLIAAGIAWPGAAAGADQASAEQREEQHEFASFAAKMAASFDIRRVEKPEVSLTLREEPVLTWSNPEHGRVYGHVFLWTAGGRPEAIASIYRWYHPLKHSSFELQSLSPGGLKASRAGSRLWEPHAAGIELKPLPHSPAPAKTPPQRLIQMRQLSRRFRVEATDRAEVESHLRLLTAPLYRYENTEQELIDGALFAFVQATDPDAVLLLEARRRSDGSTAWQFGLARLNSIELRAFHEDRQVWSAPELPWAEVQNRSRCYFSAPLR